MPSSPPTLQSALGVDLEDSSKYNTKNLGLRLGADAAAAASAGLLVAPLITMIDKYVHPIHSIHPQADSPSLPPHAP